MALCRWFAERSGFEIETLMNIRVLRAERNVLPRKQITLHAPAPVRDLITVHLQPFVLWIY